MTVQDFIKDIATKAGLDLTNADFATFIGASALREIEIPDTATDGIYKGLFTKESAKSNPELKTHFYKNAKAELYDQMNRGVNAVIKNLGYNDEFIADLNSRSMMEDGATTSSNMIDHNKKLKLFGDEFKKVVEAKQETPKVNNDEVARKIEELNNLLKQTKEGHATELENLKEQAKVKNITNALSAKISSFNLLDMSEDSKKDLANAKINKILTNYTIIEGENGGLELRDKKEPQMEVYDIQHNKLTIQDLLNRELSDFVKKSDTSKQSSTVVGASPFTAQTKPRTLGDDAAAKARERAAQELAKMQQAS